MENIDNQTKFIVHDRNTGCSGNNATIIYDDDIELQYILQENMSLVNS